MDDKLVTRNSTMDESGKFEKLTIQIQNLGSLDSDPALPDPC